MKFKPAEATEEQHIVQQRVDDITDERLEEIKIQHYNRKMMGMTNSPPVDDMKNATPQIKG